VPKSAFAAGASQQRVKRVGCLPAMKASGINPRYVDQK